MKRTGMAVGCALVLAIILSIGLVTPASAKTTRNFSAGFWGDGVRWGTVVTPAALPRSAPLSSFDGFYVVLRPAEEGFAMAQAAVVEAAPGNPAYNGGRWVTYTAVWNAAGVAAHSEGLPLLTSYSDLQTHVGLGHIDVTMESPPGGPPAFFECPLVPFSG